MRALLVLVRNTQSWPHYRSPPAMSNKADWDADHRRGPLRIAGEALEPMDPPIELRRALLPADYTGGRVSPRILCPLDCLNRG